MQGPNAALVFEFYAGNASGQRLFHEPMQVVGRLRVTEPLRADIGNTIAFRVGPTGMGRVGEVGTEAAVLPRGRRELLLTNHPR